MARLIRRSFTVCARADYLTVCQRGALADDCLQFVKLGSLLRVSQFVLLASLTARASVVLVLAQSCLNHKMAVAEPVFAVSFLCKIIIIDLYFICIVCVQLFIQPVFRSSVI